MMLIVIVDTSMPGTLYGETKDHIFENQEKQTQVKFYKVMSVQVTCTILRMGTWRTGFRDGIQEI